MQPKLSGIDHVHVYVTDRERAAQWYDEVLGFRTVEALKFWATPTGPLTIEDAAGNVHLALFERKDHDGSSAIAFGASGEEFLEWKSRLEKQGLTLRITDHTAAISLYFNDPDNNMHEITTYDHEYVRERLA